MSSILKVISADDFLQKLRQGIIPQYSQVLLDGFYIDELSAQEFTEALQSGNSFKGLSLNLEGNDISAGGAGVIAEVLKSGKCPKRFQVNLSESSLRNRGAMAVAGALESGFCPSGLKMNLGKNKIGPRGVKAIANALQSGNCPSKLHLNLADNLIGEIGAQTTAQALKSGGSPRGLRINLAGNKLGDDGVQALANALQSGKCPERLHLNLANNNIGDKGAHVLAKALLSGKCPLGLEINLENNNLSDRGMQAIAIALRSGRCPHGLQLNLGKNNFTSLSLQAISTVLKSGNCPQELKLNLEEISMDDTGMQMLVDALQTGRYPRGLELVLAHNNITDVGVQAIINAMQSGQCARKLKIDLRGNIVSDTSGRILVESILSGKIPSKLCLGGLEGFAEILAQTLANLLEIPDLQDQLDNAEKRDRIYNVLQSVFFMYPDLVLENDALRRNVQAGIQYYIHSSCTTSPISSREFWERYFPAFNEIARIILDIKNNALTTLTRKKQLASYLWSVLAENIVPPQKKSLGQGTYFWARHNLVLLEDEYQFYWKENKVLTTRWQNFQNEDNQSEHSKNITHKNTFTSTHTIPLQDYSSIYCGKNLDAHIKQLSDKKYDGTAYRELQQSLEDLKKAITAQFSLQWQAAQYATPEECWEQSNLKKVVDETNLFLDDFLSDASPQTKHELIKRYEKKIYPAKIIKIVGDCLKVVIVAAFCALVGATLGFALGVLIGGWSGPGALVTALTGLFTGVNAGWKLGGLAACAMVGATSGALTTLTFFNKSPIQCATDNILSDAEQIAQQEAEEEQEQLTFALI